MKKRVFSLALALVMALSLAPAAFAASFVSEYFPNGKLGTPKAPLLVSRNDDTYMQAWVSTPEEVMKLSAEIAKQQESDKSEKDYFGVDGIQFCIQTDVKVDGGSWHYTSAWDDPEWHGVDDVYFMIYSGLATVSTDSAKLFNGFTLIDAGYGSNDQGFVAPLLKQSGDDYKLDLASHNLTARCRWVVRYRDENNDPKAVFSDWSSETSYSAQKKLTKPTSLAAPVLSGFSVVLNENGYRSAKYFLEVPDSVSDAVLYAEGQEDMFEPISIQAQMRVNGGQWQDVYTANPNWIFSNYRVASPEGGIKESDAVEVRARFESSALGLTSAWSNIVGTSALIASPWAQAELAEAEKLGLIPDSLKGQDLTKPITRAEFAAVSVKVYESLTGTKATPVATNPFTDTKDEEVLKAYNVGVTNGISATTFEPKTLLNREQAATMLTRVYKKVAISGWTLETDGNYAAQFKTMFTQPAAFADDKNISGWAKDSVYFMAANKIINGVGDNKFAPRATTEAETAVGYAQATREAALLIATRMVKNLK